MAISTLTATVEVQRDELTGDFNGDGNDEITQKYKVFVASVTPFSTGSITGDPRDVLLAGQEATGTISAGTKIPGRNAQYGPGIPMFATNFAVTVTDERNDVWEIVVTYNTPQAGSELQNLHLHPLDRPPSFSLKFISKQIPITRAYNLERHDAIGVFRKEPITNPPVWDLDAARYLREVGTLGPITNTAGVETVDAVIETVWYGVINIRQAVLNLDFAMQRNEAYQLSTNAATTAGNQLTFGRFKPRTLKYQVSQTGDEEEQDGQYYYWMNTSIEILPTTDVFLNNVGYKQLYQERDDPDNAAAFGAQAITSHTDERNIVIESLQVDDKGVVTKVKEFATDPQFLNSKGQYHKGNPPLSVGYRYLTELDYEFFFASPPIL